MNYTSVFLNGVVIMYSLNWPYAYNTPTCTALLKVTPEDFKVTEFFSTPFSGEGEHIILKIEKKGLNTEEVVRSLARTINKPTKLISYAGLKDKQAITTQYLSVHAPGEEIEGIGELSGMGWKVLESTHHHKKLKPGFLSGNQFEINLHEVSNLEEIMIRLERIVLEGVPNYFGEQRFGLDGRNLVRAEELLVQGRKVKDKFLKSLYYSAARSWIFNLILAKRVIENTWNTVLAGDVMQLGGSNSIFVAEEADELLNLRIRKKDISPASPLAGRSKNKVTGLAQNLINEVYEQWMPWVKGLEQHGLEEAWRANILHVRDLKWFIEGTSLKLIFTLPVGAYATILLRELVQYVVPKN